MKLAVIGTGYVGLVSGACFAELGWQVTCVDTDAAKIARLEAGEIPIFEPGLERVVRQNVSEKRLDFSTDTAAIVPSADMVFIAVGTPHHDNTGGADLRYVYQVARDVAPHLKPGAVVVTKSTVPVGTGDAIHAIIAEHCPHADFSVASNPEFLREGCAVKDFLEPDRVLIGVQNPHARKMLERLYKPLTDQHVPLLAVALRTAELCKYAANAFLATKISFINEIADVCEALGADIEGVAEGMGLDKRIGRNYLSPGPGFGGSCFPKDTLALRKMARDVHVPSRVVEAVIDSNDVRQNSLLARVERAYGKPLKGATVAVLGLAFKANTDDIRYSPALVLLPALVQAGAVVQAYDPEALEATKNALSGLNVQWSESKEVALKAADIAVVLTEWNAFRIMDASEFTRAMRGKIVVDFRNLYDAQTLRDAGLEYYSIGRN